MPIESRRYGTRFDARFARWIKLEFGLSYPPLSAPVAFTIECTFRYPDGSAHSVTLTRRAQAGWTISVLSAGLGADRPGSWPNGNYQVSCRNEGQEFASGGFEVFGAGAPPPVATALVPGTRLRSFPRPGAAGDSFESGAFDTLFAEAAVPVRLAGDSTEFSCEVTDPAGIPMPFKLAARVADKSVTGTGAVALPVEPRMRGKYRVECRSGTKTSVAERFELIGKPDLPTADARVLGAALYEGGEETPDDESAAGTSFRAPEVRAFWVEALLDHPSETTPERLAGKLPDRRLKEGDLCRHRDAVAAGGSGGALDSVSTAPERGFPKEVGTGPLHAELRRRPGDVSDDRIRPHAVSRVRLVARFPARSRLPAPIIPPRLGPAPTILHAAPPPTVVPGGIQKQPAAFRIGAEPEPRELRGRNELRRGPRDPVHDGLGRHLPLMPPCRTALAPGQGELTGSRPKHLVEAAKSHRLGLPLPGEGSQNLMEHRAELASLS